MLSWENPNLWHPQWVTSLRCAIASVQTAVPRNACEIRVCARGSGHIARIKSNRTPHSGGSICTVGSVCIHVVLSVTSFRSISLRVCAVLGNVYHIVCHMWADPVRCHGHKDLFPLIRRECPGCKVARRHPCPVEGEKMIETE